MPDYSKGKIYEIVCNITKEKYIGSTVSGLSKRKAQHKEKRTTTATQIIDRKDYYINLVENYPCESKEQLLKREREWIEKGGCINKYRPIITKEEDRQRDTARMRKLALNRSEEEWNVIREKDKNRYAGSEGERRREYQRKYNEKKRLESLANKEPVYNNKKI